MNQPVFKRATRVNAKLRVFIEGASGSGKTTAALTLATQFGKVALIDTEGGSASLYATDFAFDTLDLKAPFEPERFVEAIAAAENAGYDCIVLDSASHEWMGPGGCLDIKDKLGGRFTDWAKVTPRHDRFVSALVNSRCHIIATCRSKQAYSVDDKTKKVEKLGMEPQQRDGMDYELTVVLHLNQQHIATATKDRTRLFDGRDAPVTKETADRLKEWLSMGGPDWKSLARIAYTKAPKEAADAIRTECGEDYEAMTKKLEAATNV
jgi:hypothetical protein